MKAIDFDHVAIATTDISAAFHRAVGELGGLVVQGGDGDGFRWVQTRFGSARTGMTVELLVVWNPEANDFLARFIDRHGAGVHHLTFKVPDLRTTLERCDALGLHPVGVNLDDPQWREAFLLPRAAHGTVVQLAETVYGPDDFAQLIAQAETAGAAAGTPIWWPTPPQRAEPAVTLDRVVVGSPDRRAAREFFVGLLDGALVSDTAHHTDLGWPGGGQIRVVDATRAGVLRLEGHGPSARTLDLSGTPLIVTTG